MTPPPSTGPASEGDQPPPTPAAPAIPDHAMLRCIGRGSFGEVWLARNALGLHRAVKVVRRDQMKGQRDYEREFAGLLNFEPISRTHDGFVDILQVGRGEGDDWFYYVMELADAAPANQSEDGGSRLADGIASPPILHSPSSILDPATYSPLTLSTRIRAAGRLPVAECIRLGLALTAALDHLHRHNLVHRDIKPANLIFVNGQPKLADIGLVADTSEPHTIVGTPGFMPNENAGTVQADLYALGKVLYAASTGHGATAWPAPVTSLDAQPDQKAWLELNEVVNTACHPDPKHRYASAVKMQADLALVQNGESPHSRRLWKKRFKQAGIAFSALLATVISLVFIQQLQLKNERATAKTKQLSLELQNQRDTAAARSDQIALQAKLDIEATQKKEAERGLALLELEKLIRPPHTEGWSSKAWQMASNVAAKFDTGTVDTNLQSQAAASLAGLDAHCLFQTNGVGGSSVAFSPDGKTVLFGALDDGTTNAGQAHLLDLVTTNLSAFPVPGEGPVAFLPNGTPVQFSADTNNRLALWIGPPHGRRADALVRSNSTPASASGLGEAPSIGNSAAGGGAPAPQPTALRTFTLPAGATIGAIVALALTTNASHVAASGTDTAGQPFLAAWDGPSGRLLFPVAASLVSAANSAPEDQRRLPEPPLRGPPATALAFTSDGSLLAAGHDSGAVLVWRVRRADAPVRSDSAPASASGLVATSTAGHPAAGEGTRARIAPIPASRLPIRSLAFCRDYVRDPFSTNTEPQWLLGIGDSGGGVTIWDVPTPRLRRHCQGAAYGVTALAFSPEGTLLAAGGRTPIVVWDTATGNLVSSIGGDAVSGVVFSADGTKFTATCKRGVWAACTSLWNMENGRGVRTLRGLSRQVARVCFSANTNYLAAVAHDWQVGVWNLPSNRLLHVFNMPPGIYTADNVGLAFSPDGLQFAFMAGTNAVLIDVVSGAFQKKWVVPPGRVDEMIFDSRLRLLTFHFESADPDAAPVTRPTVARIRELLPDGNQRVLSTLKEFDHGVRGAMWSHDGSFVVVEGAQLADGLTNRLVEAIAPEGAKPLWSRPSRLLRNGGQGSVLDPAGRYIAITDGQKLFMERFLCAAQTGDLVRPLANAPIILNSVSDRICIAPSSGGLALLSLSEEATLLNLQHLASTLSFYPAFSLDGGLLTWGNKDGSVIVCDLAEMRRWLAIIGMSW